MATGECAAASAVCDGPSTVVEPDGNRINCDPYLCAAGACQQQCSDNNDCVDGYVCVGSSCVEEEDTGGDSDSDVDSDDDGGSDGDSADGGTEDDLTVDSSCGCSVTGRSNESAGIWWTILLGGVLLLSRRTKAAKTVGSTLATVALILVMVACSKEVNVDGLGNDTDGDTGDEDTDADTNTDEALPECHGDTEGDPGTGGGPTMILVGLKGGDCTWIDTTEVSRSQYQEFLDSGADPEDQSATYCIWNESFEPDVDCMDNDEIVDGGLDHPAICIDWCDAQAYCEFADKTLCQGVYTKPGEAKTSIWFSACSNGDTTLYPYGSDIDVTVCNGKERGEGTTIPVTSGKTCVNGVGVQNLSGNVSEWVSACIDENGADDKCLIRGGNYARPESFLACESTEAPPRNAVFRYLGFRCCAEYDDQY